MSTAELLLQRDREERELTPAMMVDPLDELGHARRLRYRQNSLAILAGWLGGITAREHAALLDEAIREDRPTVAAVWDAQDAEDAYWARIKSERRRLRRAASGRGPRRG